MSKEIEFQGFRREAFELLQSYAKDPDQAYEKETFNKLIRDPFKALQSVVFPVLTDALKDYQLTDKNARSQHASRANQLFSHFWAAIYRKHRDGKSDDLQHFWYICENRFKFGLYIGKHAQSLSGKIIQHTVDNRAKAIELTSLVIEGNKLQATVCDTNGYLLRNLSLADLSADDELVNKHGLDFCFEFSVDEAVALGERLVDVVNEGFVKLRPLYRFLLSVDPPPYEGKELVNVEPNAATIDQTAVDQNPFSVDAFEDDLQKTGFVFSNQMPTAFCAALSAKPFLILTGLSGAGKTQLAQLFSKWTRASEVQRAVVAVGADWTSNENLLGYPDALNPGQYRKPDNGALDLILRAQGNPDLPHFLILDEMNLSHVERYFADFLSAMESGEAISLHDDTGADWSADGTLKVPAKLKIPENLFVIGTVNVDETTYMFSPKVLDRANVIEFRVSEDEMKSFLEKPVKPNLDAFSGQGASYAKAFVAAAKQKDVLLDDATRVAVSKVLMGFFPELKEAGAEFGYRTAHEICRFVYFHKELSKDWKFETAMDAAIMQKLLPKLHGSKKKLGPVLAALIRLCLKSEVRPENDPIKNEVLVAENALYPNSLEKLARMRRRLGEHGFTSFAEA